MITGVMSWINDCQILILGTGVLYDDWLIHFNELEEFFLCLFEGFPFFNAVDVEAIRVLHG